MKIALSIAAVMAASLIACRTLERHIRRITDQPQPTPRNKRRRRARRTTALARPITLPLRSRGEPLERVL